MKKHIVLDLDNTLVHSVFKPSGSYIIHQRPGLKRFLKTLFTSALSVSVWSAGTRPYVMTVVRKIFSPSQFYKLRFIYSRDQTVNINNMFIKNLRIMTKQSKDMNLKNTILIDDRPEHMILNAGRMYVIPEWTYGNKDFELEKLRLKIIARKIM